MAKGRGKRKAPSKKQKKAATAAAAAAAADNAGASRHHRNSIEPWDSRTPAQQAKRPKHGLDDDEWDDIDKRAACFRWGEVPAGLFEPDSVAAGGGGGGGGLSRTEMEIVRLREMNRRLERALDKAGI